MVEQKALNFKVTGSSPVRGTRQDKINTKLKIKKLENMNNILLFLILGAGAGVIDIVPMLIQKMDKYAIASAFVQWLVVSFVIGFIVIPGVDGWLKGLIVAIILALPIIILVAKSDPKSVPIILAMSAILGAFLGFLSKKII